MSSGSSKSSSSVSEPECEGGTCGEALWEWDGAEWFWVSGDCDQFGVYCCSDIPGICGVFVGQQQPNTCLCHPDGSPISCNTDQPVC